MWIVESQPAEPITGERHAYDGCCMVPCRGCLSHCYHHPSAMRASAQCLTPWLWWTRILFVDNPFISRVIEDVAPQFWKQSNQLQQKWHLNLDLNGNHQKHVAEWGFWKQTGRWFQSVRYNVYYLTWSTNNKSDSIAVHKMRSFYNIVSWHKAFLIKVCNFQLKVWIVVFYVMLCAGWNVGNYLHDYTVYLQETTMQIFTTGKTSNVMFWNIFCYG
jgi:hypothetical protein